MCECRHLQSPHRRLLFFFFQAEDGIRDVAVTGVQTCALPISRLHAAVTDVLERAVQSSGTTVRDYRTGTGEEGRFQFELKVYGRGGEPCVTCGKKLVTTHTIDLRATTFCSKCQR